MSKAGIATYAYLYCTSIRRYTAKAETKRIMKNGDAASLLPTAVNSEDTDVARKHSRYIR